MSGNNRPYHLGNHASRPASSEQDPGDAIRYQRVIAQRTQEGDQRAALIAALKQQRKLAIDANVMETALPVIHPQMSPRQIADAQDRMNKLMQAKAPAAATPKPAAPAAAPKPGDAPKVAAASAAPVATRSEPMPVASSHATTLPPSVIQPSALTPNSAHDDMVSSPTPGSKIAAKPAPSAPTPLDALVQQGSGKGRQTVPNTFNGRPVPGANLGGGETTTSRTIDRGQQGGFDYKGQRITTKTGIETPNGTGAGPVTEYNPNKDTTARSVVNGAVVPYQAGAPVQIDKKYGGGVGTSSRGPATGAHYLGDETGDRTAEMTAAAKASDPRALKTMKPQPGPALHSDPATPSSAPAAPAMPPAAAPVPAAPTPVTPPIIAASAPQSQAAPAAKAPPSNMMVAPSGATVDTRDPIAAAALSIPQQLATMANRTGQGTHGAPAPGNRVNPADPAMGTTGFFDAVKKGNLSGAGYHLNKALTPVPEPQQVDTSPPAPYSADPQGGIFGENGLLHRALNAVGLAQHPPTPPAAPNPVPTPAPSPMSDADFMKQTTPADFKPAAPSKKLKLPLGPISNL